MAVDIASPFPRSLPQDEKPEGGIPFAMETELEPKGDQPQAIEELTAGIGRGERDQVLLGATGTGKTFTMAKVIEATQRPAIVLAHNKTLAAQLYGEFNSFFQTTQSSTSFLITTTTNPKPMSPGPIPTSRKKHRSTSRSTGCAIRPRVRCWNVTTS